MTTFESWLALSALGSTMRGEPRLSGWCGFSTEPPCWPQGFAWEIQSYLCRSPDSAADWRYYTFLNILVLSAPTVILTSSVCADLGTPFLVSLPKALFATPILPSGIIFCFARSPKVLFLKSCCFLYRAVVLVFLPHPQPCMAVLPSWKSGGEFPSCWLRGRLSLARCCSSRRPVAVGGPLLYSREDLCLWGVCSLTTVTVCFPY